MAFEKLKSINSIPAYTIIFIGIFSTFPLFFCRNYYADDITTHLPFVKYFAEQFWSGDLYPRWLHNANAGLGSPGFFFYPPIPYYFTSLFQPLVGWLDNTGWSQLCLASALALSLSGLTCYVWLEKISNRYSAVIGAIVYMLWPYHLGFDLYHRFAFAEYWALVWLPLIAYFSVLTLRKSTIHHLIGLSFSFALLLMTHLLTFIIFFPFWLVYIVSSLGLRKLGKALYIVVFPTLISIGLSAIYWYPAVKTQYNISPDAWWDLFKPENLLFSNFPAQEFPIRYYEVMAILGAIISILLFLIAVPRLTSSNKHEISYWLGTSLVSVFMMSALSQPLWSVLSVLQKVQYSFRFQTILNLAVAALVALTIFSFESPITLSKKRLNIAIFSLLMLVLSAVIYLSVYYSALAIGVIVFLLLLAIAQQIKIIEQPKNRYFLVASILIITLTLSSFWMIGRYVLQRRNVGEHEVIAQAISVGKSAPEYRPKWVSKELFDLSDPWNTEKLIKTSRNVDGTRFVRGSGKAEITNVFPRRIDLKVSADVDSAIDIPQFYYSGWTAFTTGESQVIKTMPSKEGILQISVPPGEHNITLKLTAGKEEKTSQLISAVSMLVVLLLATNLSRIPFLVVRKLGR